MDISFFSSLCFFKYISIICSAFSSPYLRQSFLFHQHTYFMHYVYCIFCLTSPHPYRSISLLMISSAIYSARIVALPPLSSLHPPFPVSFLISLFLSCVFVHLNRHSCHNTYFYLTGSVTKKLIVYISPFGLSLAAESNPQKL